ncbi:MAG: GIY-YIG nuclease family protein [Endomicrobia bacterium]|nr:GIY-YIG nuclease family protein [Endomicrobiia bacterium]MCL2506391.1 GIY-YIG nuclease family protein [Endomicrobiia bacterium]
MSKGRVYVVTNPAFPHLFKIGYTSKDSVKKRGLDDSNAPEDFITLREYECDSPKSIEDRLHKTYDNYRHYTHTGRKTEFFYKACLNEVLGWMDDLKGLTDVTDKAIEEDKKKKKSKEYDLTKTIKTRTTFKMLNIPIGSKLTFTRDKSIKVKTVDSINRVVLSNGEQMSISAAANKFLTEMGNKSTAIQGAAFFLLDGETLWDKRLRIE